MARGGAIETRQCAEINRRALAAGPKCGVEMPGCGSLVADDLTGLSYIVRPSPSELDHACIAPAVAPGAWTDAGDLDFAEPRKAVGTLKGRADDRQAAKEVRLVPELDQESVTQLVAA